MEIEKKQNSKKTLIFGLIAFIPTALLFITGLILYLIRPLHGWYINSLGGVIGLFIIMLSRPIMPLSIIFSALAIISKAKRAKSEQTTYDKIGFILAIASCLIVVFYYLLVIIL